MHVKKTLKLITPKMLLSIRYRYRYLESVKHSHMTYSKAEASINRAYSQRFGHPINWERPTTYNEKIQVAKLYGADKVKTTLSDKILVQKWVRKHASEKEIKLIPLLAVYDSIENIDFSKLPEKYVMKMNSDSGSVFIHDKKHPVTKELLARYEHYYQKRNFAYRSFEMQYKGIEPKIMIEKYMGNAIRDYKFLCFNGKVVSCRVDFDRFENHTRNFYDKNWQLLSYNKGHFQNNPRKIEKPKNYTKMWRLAERLSKGFDQVRVDFYDIDGQIYFGEMTFTNGCGFEKFYPENKDYEFGKLWHLDMDTIRKRRKKLLESNVRICDPINFE